MTTPRSEAIPKDRYRIFLRKAAEFARSMDSAIAVKDWNAASSAAAHSVTSASDALVAYHLGLRCKGQDHRDVIRLLETIPSIGGKDHRAQILEVLDLRLVAEYHDRGVTEVEARKAAKQAGRTLAWASEHLPPSL